ncbi:hypothetical protein [Pontimicrobium aquaticum]|uniref:Uncharacterized protein n=1 Tax=Pontimicrobium aquaticum TaxID=2565367 RepID=A0A4U0EP30_9FLAO|nr:hypothetical protein [Pontimicrobium aquaticum]TJY33385.1 hypothetical protein E5167_12860 [Pontimicrobium aquaticum]
MYDESLLHDKSDGLLGDDSGGGYKYPIPTPILPKSPDSIIEPIRDISELEKEVPSKEDFSEPRTYIKPKKVSSGSFTAPFGAVKGVAQTTTDEKRNFMKEFWDKYKKYIIPSLVTLLLIVVIYKVFKKK